MGRRRKKRFPCGHEGYGAFCHRCREEEKKMQQHRGEKDALRRVRSSDPIPLDHLPPAQESKARSILRALAEGAAPHGLGGRRWVQQRREIVVFDLGKRYRLIVREEGGRLIPEKALSHEEYNKYKP